MRVLAALSGGVDSAVAAAKAVEAGHDVVGVHMALSSQPQECRIGSRGCCSIEDSGDAARAADIIGIPFYVWDLAQEFEQTVITDFVEQYRVGRTPNPCVRCNEFVKFRELASRARALGFDAVCTGHYAAIVDGEVGPELHRGADTLKDQSYVLAVMGAEELTRVVLPLGDAPNKAWVRSEAERLGLGVSNKPDSYDICFIPDGDTWVRPRATSLPPMGRFWVATRAIGTTRSASARAWASARPHPTVAPATSSRPGPRLTKSSSVPPSFCPSPVLKRRTLSGSPPTTTAPMPPTSLCSCAHTARLFPLRR